MKVLIMKNVVFLLLVIIYNSHAQNLSEEIIIQGPQPNEWYKSSPVIDIDSQGNIGIVWANTYNDHYTINFIRSTDGGNTFDSIRVVEDIPYDPDGTAWLTGTIIYDVFDNPLVVYNSFFYPWTYEFRLKKSFDGGNSFLSNFQSFYGTSYNYNFMLSDSGIGYIALHQNEIIKIFKTSDYGLSFPDSTIINNDGFSVSNKIQIIQCGNGDILCFWSGQDQITHRNAIFYSRSTDEGKSFQSRIELDSTTQSPVKVNAIANENKVFIIYRGLSDSTNFQLLYRTSEDFGYTFSDFNIFYNYGTTPEMSSLTTLRFLPQVGLCIAWNYMNSVKRIMFTRSKDFGATFDSSMTIVSERRQREWESMAVSDSGDIYIVSTEQVDYYYYYIVLNKIRIPLLTTIDPGDKSTQKKFRLHQNYPNPFNSTTIIPFQIDKSYNVKIGIYDLLGKEIKLLESRILSRGNYSAKWDGKNNYGANVASGIYLYTFKAKALDGSKETFQKSSKLLLLR